MKLAAVASALILLTASPAKSQSGEADFLSDLISACRTADMQTDKTDSLNDSILVPDNDVSSVIAFLCESKQTSDASPLGALATITSAYEASGYYSSGKWVKDEDLFAPPLIAPPVTGLQLPVKTPARVTSEFGYRPLFRRYHLGTDIALCVGDTICSPLSGIVTAVSYDKGYGNYIIIDHDNGLQTRYAHLSKSLVVQGLRIHQSQPIALSGNTGNSTGPHLHLETRYKKIPLDPRLVFDFRRDLTPEK